METIEFVLTGFGIVLAFVAVIVFKQNAQIAVLQKTVDMMAERMDIFIKKEIDYMDKLIEKLS